MTLSWVCEQQFIQDVMDGYFPSELQKRFPHGVPFEVSQCLFFVCLSVTVQIYNIVVFLLKVFDKRDEEFIFKQPWERFPGEGRTVCGKKEESSNVRRYQTTGLSWKQKSDTDSRNPQSVFSPLYFFSGNTGNKLTMDQFLNRMPKVVIKAGKVIGVRKSLRETLQVKNAEENISPNIPPPLTGGPYSGSLSQLGTI